MAKTALLFLVLAIFCFALGQSATVTVTVGANNANAFSPTAVTLNIGDTITFQYSSGTHTVTSAASLSDAQNGLFGSALGVTFDNSCQSSGCPTAGVSSFTTSAFNTAGFAAFFCRFHFNSNQMFGTITVNSAAGTSAAAAGTSAAAAGTSAAAAGTSAAAAGTSAAAAGTSAAAAGSSAAAAGSSAAAAGTSAAAAGSSFVAASSNAAASSFAAASSAQAGSSLNLGTGCGNGIVNSGEQCDIGAASKRIWELNCCQKRNCQFLPANVICGSLSRARYLANYCFASRTETCSATGTCTPRYLAAGVACVSTTGVKGTCTAGASGSATTCVTK